MEIVAKKYRVLKELGVGAMGEVYLVLPPKGDPVALKLLKSLEAKANTEAVSQFENEFKTLKRLSHPNIGNIIDYGYDEELEKVFFTLPWLKGCELYDACKNLEYEKCEDLFVQALRALNYLHQKDIIHCDLKPGNVYVEDGKVLLIDFGLAGYRDENIVGTPTYLAPEIFRGAHHAVTSDLYAMGVIIYNCLTRTQPFSGKDIQEVYNRHRSFSPPPIHEVNRDVPKYMSDIVATLLNKKPEERYPSAASVIEEIDTYSEHNYSVETEETLLSYLPTESDLVVGRHDAVEDINIALTNFKASHIPQPYHLIFVEGQKNVGKNRVVAKIKNELQLGKVPVETINPPLSDGDMDSFMSAKALIFENIDNFFVTKSEILNFKKVADQLENKILDASYRFVFVASSSDQKYFENIQKLFPEEETIVTNIHLEPYTQDQTTEFLQHIIGQDEIPKNFAEHFHRNTEGLPGIALELIQTMISNGLLFDKSGRWNEDLLTELDTVFESMEISESLEEEFNAIFDSLSGDEEDILNWLCICPHPLHFSQIQKLTRFEGLDTVLDKMVDRHILKEEEKEYTFYRSVFQNFVQSELPESEQRKRHTHLANPKLGLDKNWAIYHLSFGVDPSLRLRATEKLCTIYQEDGDREHALETYLKLIDKYSDQPVQKRLDWHIEAATLMIWLDKFKDATDLITSFEQEIQETKPNLDPKKFLTLLEKKGVSLLHRQEMDKAKVYFTNGLNHSKKYPDARVQQLRFANDIAEIEFILGHHDSAIKTFMQTRQIGKKLTPKELTQITNNDLGHVYINLQDFDKAIPFLVEDIKNFSSLKTREPLARALYSFAEAMRATDKIDKAIRAYQECVNICKFSHLYPLLLRAYNGLGNLYLALQNNDDALKSYQKAIDISVRLKEQSLKAALLFNQGFIYKQSHNFALARRKYLLCKQVLENKDGKLLNFEEILLSRSLNELSSLAQEDQNTMQALSYQLERLQLVEKASTLASEKVLVKLNLAELYLDNRLEDQFKKECSDLESIVESEDHKKLLADLKERWSNVASHDAGDSTGVLESPVA